ncbi:MAG: cytochrome c5 family protein [Hyphomonadaceae bacterium]|nr:cytochrome c5 family protein [Hyphomonadaceae bacterium]
MRTFVIVFALGALAACNAPAQPQDNAAARAAAAEPADPRLAELYRGACRNCHGSVETGAPLALDHREWDERWRKGEATLLEHTIGGFNGMPAGGQCFSCTADDYRALIRFMAGRED